MDAPNSASPLARTPGPFCVTRHERTLNALVGTEVDMAPTSQDFERPPFIRSVSAPPALHDLLAAAQKEISERELGHTWPETLNKTTNTSNYKQLLDALQQHYPEVDRTYEGFE